MKKQTFLEELKEFFIEFRMPMFLVGCAIAVIVCAAFFVDCNGCDITEAYNQECQEACESVRSNMKARNRYGCFCENGQKFDEPENNSPTVITQPVVVH